MNNQLKKFEGSENMLPSFFNRYWNGDFFNDFFNGDSFPATNVKENKKEFKLDLSVPGFDKGDLNIEIEKNVLKISAQKNIKNEEKDANDKVLRREFGSTSFCRSFTIPENVDTEHIQASQADGILHITLPKLDKAIEDKIKKIDVK